MSDNDGAAALEQPANPAGPVIMPETQPIMAEATQMSLDGLRPEPAINPTPVEAHREPTTESGSAQDADNAPTAQMDALVARLDALETQNEALSTQLKVSQGHHENSAQKARVDFIRSRGVSEQFTDTDLLALLPQVDASSREGAAALIEWQRSHNGFFESSEVPALPTPETMIEGINPGGKNKLFPPSLLADLVKTTMGIK